MKVSQYFIRGKRESGQPFTKLSDDAPEWLRDAVQEAHSTDLPNDWIFEQCRDAAFAWDDELFNGRYPEDAVHEHADSNVDVYTSDLYRWAADMCLSHTFANAEYDLEGMGGEGETVKRLMGLQYCSIRHITQTVVDACRAAEEDEEGGES